MVTTGGWDGWVTSCCTSCCLARSRALVAFLRSLVVLGEKEDMATWICARAHGGGLVSCRRPRHIACHCHCHCRWHHRSFVRLFVCSFVRLFIRSFVCHSKYSPTVVMRQPPKCDPLPRKYAGCGAGGGRKTTLPSRHDSPPGGGACNQTHTHTHTGHIHTSPGAGDGPASRRRIKPLSKSTRRKTPRTRIRRTTTWRRKDCGI